MKCQNCNSTVRDSARFCTHCGCRIEGTSNYPMKKKSKLWIAVVALVLVVTIAVGGAVWYITKPELVLSDYDEQITLGYNLIDKGDYEEAIVKFDKAISIDEKKPDGYVGKASAMAYNNDEAEAVIDVLDTGYELTGGAVEIIDAYTTASDIFAELGEDEKAEKVKNARNEEAESEEVLDTDVKTAYIDAYKEILNNYYTVTHETLENDDNPRGTLANMGLNPNVSYGTDLSYALKDLNNDSSPELFIASCGENNNVGSDFFNSDYTIYDIYTMDGNMALSMCGELDTVGYRQQYKIRRGNIITFSGSSSFDSFRINFFRLPENSTELSMFYVAGYDKTILGEGYFSGNDMDNRISEDEWNSLEYTYPIDEQIEWISLDNYDKLESWIDESGNSDLVMKLGKYSLSGGPVETDMYSYITLKKDNRFEIETNFDSDFNYISKYVADGIYVEVDIDDPLGYGGQEKRIHFFVEGREISAGGCEGGFNANIEALSNQQFGYELIES